MELWVSWLNHGLFTIIIQPHIQGSLHFCTQVLFLWKNTQIVIKCIYKALDLLESFVATFNYLMNVDAHACMVNNSMVSQFS